MKMKQRATFSGRIGFVLAAAGSAVGLGNIWRFPYLAAKYGGGAFLIVYISFALTFGFTLMISEIAIGRKTKKSAITAYAQLNKKWKFLGVLSALVAIIIVPYYCVIGGWLVKYLTAYLAGANAATDSFFSNFISDPVSSTVCWLIFLSATAGICALGVNHGIERISKIFMPVLLILLIVITVYVISIPGSGAGVAHYLIPRIEDFNLKSVLGATGQMFYSMSLAMGIMITYGSYMGDSDNIESSVHQIEIFDTVVSLLAGLMIVPAVYVFSKGDAYALNAGPSLMFVTMPKVFASMGIGRVIGFGFFALVLFAAITSSISLFEVLITNFCDSFGLTRTAGLASSYAICLILGALSCLGFSLLSGVTPIGMDFLTFFDYISNSILMPIVALLMCVFIGYVIKTQSVCDEIEETQAFKAKKLYGVFIKFVAPVILFAILVSSALSGLGLINI